MNSSPTSILTRATLIALADMEPHAVRTPAGVEVHAAGDVTVRIPRGASKRLEVRRGAACHTVTLLTGPEDHPALLPAVIRMTAGFGFGPAWQGDGVDRDPAWSVYRDSGWRLIRPGVAWHGRPLACWLRVREGWCEATDAGLAMMMLSSRVSDMAAARRALTVTAARHRVRVTDRGVAETMCASWPSLAERRIEGLLREVAALV